MITGDSMPSDRFAALPGDTTHLHVYDDSNPLPERRMRIVAIITAVMMVVEIGAGWLFHSMALLADGWHMSTHALALGLAAAAYAVARRLSKDERFAFGTWKIEVLGGYTSALLLVLVALYILFESASHLLHPSPIAVNEALSIAGMGLIVNVVCAWLLGDASHHHGRGHGHDQGHDHGHDHDHVPALAGGHDPDPEHAHRHRDLNLRSAYIHVAADAAVSVLAIGALAGAKFFGLVWLDAAVGFVGALVVALWAAGLLRDTSRVLLDAEMDVPLVAAIRQAVISSPIPARIQDLHVWRVSRRKYACLLSVATDGPATPEHFRRVLAGREELVHVTVEVNDAGAS